MENNQPVQEAVEEIELSEEDQQFLKRYNLPVEALYLTPES